jgi:hypothetical protein
MYFLSWLLLIEPRRDNKNGIEQVIAPAIIIKILNHANFAIVLLLLDILLTNLLNYINKNKIQKLFAFNKNVK